MPLFDIQGAVKRCRDSISHNEAESVLKEHVLDGTRVLAEAVLGLAGADGCAAT
jgi:hypothetical protein